MAVTAEQISTARKAGYSDDEIVAHLATTDPAMKTAVKAGYTPAEIMAHFDKAPAAKPAGNSPETVGEGQYYGFAQSSPEHRAAMEQFIRTQAPRSLKQEAVRGIPFAGRIADATMGTYNDPVYPQRTVDKVLGKEVSPTTGGAILSGVNRVITNPNESLTNLAYALPDLATGAYKAATSPENGSLAKFAGETVKGALAPTGLIDLAQGSLDMPQARQAWENDALGSGLMAYGALKGGIAAKNAAVNSNLIGKTLNALPDSVVSQERLSRSALKPYIGESAAKNKQTAKALETFGSDVNASARLPKFFDKNMKEMESIVGRQNMYLDEKGHVRADISPVEKQLKDFVDSAKETPGTAETSIAAAEKVLNDIKSHPDYRAADNSLSTSTLQSMKTNTWNYLRKKNAFNSDSDPALQGAMWDAATGMNEIINKYIPEMAGENARYGELANVNKLLKRAIDRHANNNIIPLRSLIQLVRGDVAGFTAAASMWAFDHPTFKSYLAQKMAKAKGKPVTQKEVNRVIEEIKADPQFNPEVLPGKQSSQMDVIPGSNEAGLEQGGYRFENPVPIQRQQTVANPEQLPGTSYRQETIDPNAVKVVTRQKTVENPEKVPGRQSSQMEEIVSSRLTPKMIQELKAKGMTLQEMAAWLSAQ